MYRRINGGMGSAGSYSALLSWSSRRTSREGTTRRPSSSRTSPSSSHRLSTRMVRFHRSAAHVSEGLAGEVEGKHEPALFARAFAFGQTDEPSQNQADASPS